MTTDKPSKLPTYQATTTSAFKTPDERKTQVHLVMALTGVPGSGKTYTALKLASHLGKRVAVIDTETDSALLYQDLFKFDHASLTNFLPRNYIKLITDAIQAKYDVIVVDSLSPSWNGKAGILEIAGGDFRGWRAATPEHQDLIAALTGCRRKVHLIATLRSKIDYSLTLNEAKGKTEVRSLGLQPIHRDDTPYEFDIVANLSREHILSFGSGKTRYPDLDGLEFPNPGEDLAKLLLARLAVINNPPSEAS